MAEQAASSHRINVVNGLHFPTALVLQEGIDKLKHMKLYEDDVWIVSFAKSGSTWLQQIVRLIKNRGEPSDEKISVAVPWFEAVPQLHPELKIDEIPRPRAFKSHFPYHLLPCGPPNTTPCKYIYIVRNPKDVAVSAFYHYKLNTSVYPEFSDFDIFWEFFKGDNMTGGNYFDHLTSWMPHKDDQNVLFLTYEGMKMDPVSAISKISSFMEIELPDDIIAKIADLTSFENMKKDRAANRCWRFGERDDGVSKFMRKGIVGDWKTHLTEEQSAQIDALCAEKLKDIDFKFTF